MNNLLSEKHLSVIEELHKNGYPAAKWIFDDEGKKTTDVYILLDADQSSYNTIHFDDTMKMTKARLDIELADHVDPSFYSIAEKLYQGALNTINRILDINPKWRALAEDWDGDMVETYQAILFKDDNENRFFLKEIFAAKEYDYDKAIGTYKPVSERNEGTTELTEHRALDWILTNDPGSWSIPRLKREFSNDLVDSKVCEKML